MKFKVDENLPAEIANALRNRGHDAMTVLEQALGGHPDTSIAAVCKQEERVLVTLDVDFANMQAFPPADYPGLIVLRLHRQDKGHVLNAFSGVLDLIDKEPLAQTLWIVEEGRLRLRK